MCRFIRLSLASALLAVFIPSVVGKEYVKTKTSPDAACEFFKLTLPGITLLPGDAGYPDENRESWSTAAWLGPACILTPNNAIEVSTVVRSIVRYDVPFAMRGGGHMPIANAANIDSSGILISSTNLNVLRLSNDKQTMSIGPGPRWGDVYEYLEGTGLQVVGGRLGPVGVPGYLLGGGMSFYSYEYGFSSTNGNIRAIECVLADGRIVTATATNHYSDLFWALQGGGNSFCIATRFDLKTIPAPATMMSEGQYGGGEAAKEGWIDSVYNFATKGDSDPKGSIIPVINLSTGMESPEYSSTLFYNGNNTNPAVLGDWLGETLKPANITGLIPLTLAQYSKAVRPAFEKGGQGYGLRHSFYVLPVLANKEAMHIVHDTFFATVQSQLSNLANVTSSLAYNPITKKFLAESNKGIGCPQGLEETPVFWIEESISYASADYDAVIDNFTKTVNADIITKLEAIGANSKYLYLNDAAANQDVFGSYPPQNLARLKSIRAKYDPNMVYTKLMPGGFKVQSS